MDLTPYTFCFCPATVRCRLLAHQRLSTQRFYWGWSCGTSAWHVWKLWPPRESRFQHSHSVCRNGLGPGKPSHMWWEPSRSPHSQALAKDQPCERPGDGCPRPGNASLQPLSGNVRFDWWSRSCLVSSCSTCFPLATNKPFLGAPYGPGSTLLLIQCLHRDTIPTGDSSWDSLYQGLQTPLPQIYQPVLYSRRESAWVLCNLMLYSQLALLIWGSNGPRFGQPGSLQMAPMSFWAFSNFLGQ